ncbi:hypothetical protein [Lacrimispora indolis]|uniref:hypothetical protein n=1 Tax=Lacrimispora indolis TaxID=69825 RepID=UPI00045EBE58|nr:MULTISPECIES: hypothetical protein [Lachnospiraceae]
MRLKLLFVWHILIFNVIKPLPYSSDYFNNHFRTTIQNSADCDSLSRYVEIVKFGMKHSGWSGIVLANIALMFFCLPLCFSADLVIHAAHLLSIKITVNAVLVLMMLEKFDMLRFRDRRNYLKLLYLFICLVSSSYWTLTCVFLSAFENLML